MAGSDNNDDFHEELGNQFDHDQHSERQRQLRALKSQNIRSVFGSGAGRLAIVVFGGAMALFIIVGAYNLFKRKPVATPDNHADRAVVHAPTNGGDMMVTSDAEAQLRRQANNQKAEEAARQGKSFMPPPVLKADSAPASQNTTASPNPTGSMDRRAQQLASEHAPAAIANSAALAAREAEIAAVRQKWEATRVKQIEPQLQAVLGRTEQGQAQGTFSSSYYALPDRTPKPPATPPGTAAPAGAATALANAQTSRTDQKPFIEAGDGYYCETDYALTTDSARNDVFATCYQGKLAGAKLIGKFQPSPENASEGSVSVLFSTLSLPGQKSIPIQALGIDDASQTSALADDVDDHTFRKYSGLMVASMLKGIGQAASMVTGTTTTTATGASATTTTITEPMTTSREAKIAAGQVGIAIGNEMEKNSANVKRTVSVNAKKGLRVVFLADVYTEKNK